MADRFLALGADNSGLVVTPAQVPKTINYSDLTPFEGTLPTFTTAPAVSVMGAGHQRHFDVDTVGTTSFRIIAASSGGPPTSATLNIEIISLETASASPSSGVAIDFPYFCSLNDVDNEIINLTVAIAGQLEHTIKRLFISQSYGEVNAALAAGGYDLPVLNLVKQAISGAITASDNVRSFTVTDGTAYSISKTVRIHGQTGSIFNSEFVPIVGISTNVLTVEFAKNSYDADSTCELCTLGFLHLRNCNTLGAAYRALNALAVKNPQLSEKATEMREVYEMCLADLREGTILLNGLTQDGNFIETIQTADSDKNIIIFEMDGNIF